MHRCNTWIKFGLLLDRARAIGAERLATGHYARIVEGDDGWELHTARHPAKDQSYYLFELSQEQLAVSTFPFGELTKEQTRDLARQAELVVAEKGESMELCFVSGGVRRVRASAGGRARRCSARRRGRERGRRLGGTRLGTGAPYYRYTVGQRRGLGVATGERLYVLDVSPADNLVVIGGLEELQAEGLAGERCHWIGPPPEAPVEATVKIRARHPGVACRIHPQSEGRVDVEFAEPQTGVAPGQAAVFYRGSRVLGGAWIRAAR